MVRLSTLVVLLSATPSSFAFVCSSSSSSSSSSTSASSTRNINLPTVVRSTSFRAAGDVVKATTVMTARGRQQHEASACTTPAAAGEEIAASSGDASSSAGGAAVSRGRFLAAAALGSSAAVLAMFAAPQGASANGMLDVPPARLNNRYFLMRSGQGAADREGLVQSHPIDKLHMDNRLTDQGVAEAQRAAGVLRGLGVYDAFIWADISSRAQDTARILANELGIRQERVVPEYAFLDPRGMGMYDGKDVASVLPQVYKEDAISLTWRPPPNTDGTPNESVNDVFVRVRQLMSKLETQYQGEDVIIVGADSDCLSVLQSFVLGEDLGQHSKYYLRPGEGRQLRTSLDTEVGYKARREAKGNAVAAASGGDKSGGEEKGA